MPERTKSVFNNKQELRGFLAISALRFIRLSKLDKQEISQEEMDEIVNELFNMAYAYGEEYRLMVVSGAIEPMQASFGDDVDLTDERREEARKSVLENLRKSGKSLGLPDESVKELLGEDE